MIEGLQLQLYQPLSISLMRNRETLIKVVCSLKYFLKSIFCFVTVFQMTRLDPFFATDYSMYCTNFYSEILFL